MNWLANLDPRLWQAVIAGVFVAVGWLVNGWQNRRVARLLRHEKLRDYHRAIYAEIGANLANLESEAALNAQAKVIMATMDADPNYVPFIPRERNDTMFRALVSDIHVLPRQTIDNIVEYYSQIQSIEAMVEDMRGATYPTLNVARKKAIYADCIEMKKQALAFGSTTIAVIKAFSDGGPEAAKAEEQRLSNRPAVDRSGQ